MSSRYSVKQRPVLYILGSALFLTMSSGLMCPWNVRITPSDPAIAALLAPAPTLSKGFYDFNGVIKNPSDAGQMVRDAGLDSAVASNFARIGLVHVTEQFIQEGRDLFFKQSLGSNSTLQDILNFGGLFGAPPLELISSSFDPVQDPDGVRAFVRELFSTVFFREKRATTNLQVKLLRDLRLGSQVFRTGAVIDTGLDVGEGDLFPVGLEAGTLTCAACHASVDPSTGRMVAGRPNMDINIKLFVALSSNTAAVFLRLSPQHINPFDPVFPKTGLRIIDSTGATVQLPSPRSLEDAIDDFIMTSVPFGGFEAAPDATTAVTKIPDAFVFGEGGMGWDGGFQIGPFGGVSAFSSGVHTLELNLLSVPPGNIRAAGLDPEVYLGLVLQNAAKGQLRPPNDVRPSEWLAQNHGNLERDIAVVLPTFPNPTLYSINGLALSPPGKPFLHDANALSAFQASLVCPPNRSFENLVAMQDGSVERGAAVFQSANCASCHPSPYFTNGAVVSNETLKVSNARGKNRFGLKGILVEAVMPSYDQPVPLPANPNLLTLPSAPGEASNLNLPKGLDTPAGGYKVTGLIGTFFKAPYLHDGSLAVGPEAIRVREDGSYEMVTANQIGVPGTTLINKPVSAPHSLRALVDRELRQRVIESNRANAAIARGAVDGGGHEFFVDPAAGFTYRQQTDLINFLLALDDNPGVY